MLNFNLEESANKIKGLEMVPKKENGKKPRFEEYKEKKMPKEEANREMENFFAKLEEEMKDVPQEVVEAGAGKVIDLVKGKLSWAEIFNVSPEMMKQMAELGYVKFQAGRMEEAERFFKVLTVLDSKNSYFRSMLGTILQRQKRYGEAVVQFTEAIDINPLDTISLVNRGEVFMLHNWLKDAEADFKKAITLDPTNEDKWADRARMFMTQLAEIKRRRQEAKKKPKKTKEKKKK
jgi:tetratricopeptide (TPR) repeat protein